jgi:hypothetical protein
MDPDCEIVAVIEPKKRRLLHDDDVSALTSDINNQAHYQRKSMILQRLRGKTTKDLNDYARRCGLQLSKSGVKQEKKAMIDSLHHGICKFLDPRGHWMGLGQIVQRVISIDVGTRNMATVIYDVNRNLITQIEIHDLQLKSTKGLHIVQQCGKFLEELALNNKDLILIEEQRNRTAGGPVHGEVYKIKIVEAVLHAMCKCSSVSVLPQSVATFIGHGGVSKQIKKKKAIALSQEWILDGTLLFERPSLIRDFETSKKKDDLADALVQLKAYLAWQHELIELGKYLSAEMS